MASNVDDFLKNVMPTKGGELGHGKYGRVFAVKYDGQNCAAREIHSNLVENENRDEFTDSFIRECNHCKKISHPNIVQLLGVYYSSEKSYLPIMVMELMHTSLTSFVDNNQSKISMLTKLSILSDASLGLSYLHARRPAIAHGDLSSNNVLLNSQLVAKIGDLGVARAMRAHSGKNGSTSDLAEPLGTLAFMSPETFDDNPEYGTAADAFSFCAITLHVFAEKWPEPSAQRKRDPATNKLQLVCEADRRQTYLEKIPNDFVNLKKLLQECLDDCAEKRPAIQNVSKMILQAKESATVPDKTNPSEGVKPINESSFAEALQNDEYRIKWTSCKDVPSKFYNASVAVSAAGDMVYVTAGTSSTDKYDVYSYNTATEHWKVLPQSGHRRGVLHMIEDRLSIFGGEDSDNREVSNKVTTFNSSTNKWYSCYPDMLNNRYIPGIVTYKYHVIVMGGYRAPADFYRSIEILDYRYNLQWKEMSARLPAPMWNFKPTISSNNITIVGFSTNGGRDKRCFQVLAEEITAQSQPQRGWIEFNYPAHWETAIVPYSNPPLIIGGRESRYSISDIAMYDASMNVWRKVGSLRSPRNSTAVALINTNTIMIIGGCTDGSTIVTSKQTSLKSVELGTIGIFAPKKKYWFF